MREIVTLLGVDDKPIDIDVPKNLVRPSVDRYASDAYVAPTGHYDDVPKNVVSGEYRFLRIYGLMSRLQGITTMSTYNAEFPFAVAFPPQRMTNVLAEWLAKQGCKQCHVAGM